jgi:hypothetical protein
LNAASAPAFDSRRMPVRMYTDNDRISSAMKITSRSVAVAISIMPPIAKSVSA